MNERTPVEESNAKRRAKHPARWDRWRRKSTRHLREWLGQHRRNVTGEFLQGAPYKLGSGSVTLLILRCPDRGPTAWVGPPRL
jgi:hypothetical protein